MGALYTWAMKVKMRFDEKMIDVEVNEAGNDERSYIADLSMEPSPNAGVAGGTIDTKFLDTLNCRKFDVNTSRSRIKATSYRRRNAGKQMSNVVVQIGFKKKKVKISEEDCRVEATLLKRTALEKVQEQCNIRVRRREQDFSV